MQYMWKYIKSSVGASADALLYGFSVTYRHYACMREQLYV